MAITASIGKSLNPLSSALTGGLIPSDNVIVNVAAWADALEPRDTPVLSKIKTGPAVNNPKIEWGQSYRAPLTGTVAEPLDTTEVAIDLAAGEGKLMQKWYVLAITDFLLGSTTQLDYSTREEVIIDTEPDGTDTITVKRGNGSGTGVAHTTGARWEIVGVAMPYNTDFSLSPFVRGDRIYNHPQRFYGEVAADVAARNTPTYETAGDQFLKDFKEQTMLQKHLLEKTIVAGQRLTGNAATAAIPHKMGGLDYFITNHSGRVTNCGGSTLSAYDFDDVFRDIFKEIRGGNRLTFLAGPDTTAVFDTLINRYRQATMSDTKINLLTDSIGTRFGTLDIQPTQHMPEGIVLLVPFERVSLRPYKGCSWSTKEIATDGPYDKRAIWGDYTLVCEEINRYAKVWNFDTNLDNYDRRDWF